MNILEISCKTWTKAFWMYWRCGVCCSVINRMSGIFRQCFSLASLTIQTTFYQAVVEVVIFKTVSMMFVIVEHRFCIIFEGRHPWGSFEASMWPLKIFISDDSMKDWKIQACLPKWPIQRLAWLRVVCVCWSEYVWRQKNVALYQIAEPQKWSCYLIL